MKNLVAQRKLAEALKRVSERRGVSVDELEESSVPALGLDARGCRRERIGPWEVEIFPQSIRAFGVRWLKQGGKTSAQTPAQAEREHPDQCRTLEKLLKEMNELLAVQRLRLERFLANDKSWNHDAWLERYLNHPLMGIHSRSLIWEFETGGQVRSGIWHEGKMIDVKGRELAGPCSRTRVRLWHPIGKPASEVLAWRCWLEEFLVVQPFRQAYREIYVPTPAERRRTASNRFAGLMVKQHQFAALARQRGWHYHPMGCYDSYNVPTLAWPEVAITAEFEVDAEPDAESSDSGTLLCVGTRQVRFLGNGSKPLLLGKVPSRLFSETMRDVDLFVSVANVGNDPAWPGRLEPGGRQRAWQLYALGELTTTAGARRDLLAALLPKLPCAGQFRLAGRFLVVKGKLRTYKIHLGSANVLMEPNDQFLCFTPARHASEPPDLAKLFVRFQDDQTLVQILRKARLLAEDSKIRGSAFKAQVACSDTGIIEKI